MATVVYNSISITQAKITRFATENEYEGDNRNRTGKKHILEGVGIYKNTAGFNTAIGVIRGALNVPGKLLSIIFEDGGGTLNLATGSDDSATYASIRDTRNGPKPVVTVTEITGGNTGTFVIGFSFEWHNCNSSPIQRAEIIITHKIDEEGVSTIERRGSISVSESNTGTGGPTSNPVVARVEPTATKPYANITDLNSSSTSYSASPSDYRHFVSGIVPKGFRRTQQEFYVEPDQRTLAFTITDTQVAASLPSPALGGDASYEYERGLDGNEMGIKTFRCTLSGPPVNADDPTNAPAGISTYQQMRSSLFFRALEIAMTRIRFQPPTPDTIMSFKIAEPSLFKRNEIVLEIVAKGTPTSTPLYEPSGSVDTWLYFQLFSSPNPRNLQPFQPSAYGIGTFGVGYAPKFKFDPCTLTNTWTVLAGTSKGVAVTLTPSGDPNDLTVNPNNNGSGRGDVFKTPDTGKPDSLLEKDAREAVLTYKASQRLDSKTGMTVLETMGDQQYNFQMTLPRVTMTQTVEMATRVRGMNIPWPIIEDPYTVVEQNIEMNDAPPDAAGNRIIAIRATRTIQIQVSASSNLRTATDANESNPRAVWMPDAIALPRNAFTGSVDVPLKENKKGVVTQQDYVGKDTGD